MFPKRYKNKCPKRDPTSLAYLQLVFMSWRSNRPTIKNLSIIKNFTDPKIPLENHTLMTHISQPAYRSSSQSLYFYRSPLFREWLHGGWHLNRVLDCQYSSLVFEIVVDGLLLWSLMDPGVRIFSMHSVWLVITTGKKEKTERCANSCRIEWTPWIEIQYPNHKFQVRFPERFS